MATRGTQENIVEKVSVGNLFLLALNRPYSNRKGFQSRMDTNIWQKDSFAHISDFRVSSK